MLIFRQLFDPRSSTYTYLLGDRASGEAVLIDPVFEQARRDAALVARARPAARVDARHARARRPRHRRLAAAQRCGSRIALSRAAARERRRPLLDHGDRVEFGARQLEVRATPGHTSGCLTYVLDDQSMAFTGDCLLIRGCGRTDFQQGRRAHAVPLGARADLHAAATPACSTRPTTTAASPSPASPRSGATTRAWAARSARPTSPAT